MGVKITFRAGGKVLNDGGKAMDRDIKQLKELDVIITIFLSLFLLTFALGSSFIIV